jgi:hypothetical protein
MTLFDQVVQDVRQLAGRGWQTLLAQHGLDLGAADLPAELQRDIGATIDRSKAGFEDFAGLGRRAIEPGDPALSLLYHAFASPLVHPTADGKPGAQADYPALEQIDSLENLIYGLGRDSVAVPDLVPAVFAYEYRPAGRTPHKRHADLVFSRTGITRNGKQPALYDRIMRSFAWCDDAGEDVRVLPARYGVFLARRIYGSANTGDPVRYFSLLGTRLHSDSERNFLVPVHKLFEGAECLTGSELKVRFKHRHVGEKLARACRVGALKTDGFDLSADPFVIVSGEQEPGPIKLAGYGASRVVQPDGAPLIKEACQGGRRVVFTVPGKTILPVINRDHTSLRLSDSLGTLALEGLETLLEGVLNWLSPHARFPRPRNAPEFVNIRHIQTAAGVEDMRRWADDAFNKAMSNGGYEALLFVDGCADGCVSAAVEGANLQRVRPAFSIVAPPDFFPSLDQMELWEWLHEKSLPVRTQFKEGGPDPLCFGRLPPNPATIDPFTARHAFQQDDEPSAHRDETMAAVVSRNPRVPPAQKSTQLTTTDADERANFLPDAASAVFAPGWDVTYASNADIDAFYATYGLGSPFPEDVKLCAAANSFWPAVSPDSARTFGITKTPTAMPLLDDELGYHFDHPLRVAGKVQQSDGWDGEQGCFLEQSGDVVNVADIDRSDYVANLRDKKLSFTRLGHISSDEMFHRMLALRDAVAKVDSNTAPAETDYLLLSMEPVAEWSTVQGSGLTGPGYRFVFARLGSDKLDQTMGRHRYRIDGKLARCRWAKGKAPRVDMMDPGKTALKLYAY